MKKTLCFLGIMLVFAFAATITLLAQDERGTTLETATVIETGQVSDDLDGSDYKFKAGPGKITFTFEVEAAETNAGATFDVYDTRSRPLLSSILLQGVDKGSERAVKSIKLTRPQDVVIRVKGIRYGDKGGVGNYSIALDGAVVKTDKAPVEFKEDKPAEKLPDNKPN
jgi:hypothetical protein